VWSIDWLFRWSCLQILEGHGATVYVLVTLVLPAFDVFRQSSSSSSSSSSSGGRTGEGGKRVIISGSGDRTIRVWSATSLPPGAKRRAGESGLESKEDEESDDGGDGDDDEHGSTVWICDQILVGHRGPVWALLAWHDGRVLSGSSDGTIRMWGLHVRDNNAAAAASATAGSAISIGTANYINAAADANAIANANANADGSNSYATTDSTSHTLPASAPPLPTTTTTTTERSWEVRVLRLSQCSLTAFLHTM
jgi:WD40 repeat protein